MSHLHEPAARRAATIAGVIASCLLATACGLPGGGVRRVDDAEVPYRLLEPTEASASATPPRLEPDATTPLVFWVDSEDRLVPAASGGGCSGASSAQLERLLDQLSEGPPETVRAAGLTSAWGPLSSLDLVALDGTTAVVRIDSTTQTSADRLPLALGQVALSLSTARGVDAVSFVDDDGEPVQVPLPGGELTSASVSVADYTRLLAEGGSGSGERWPGCP